MPCQVLVVDDDREIREVLASVLSDAGYAVCTAADGYHAWETLLHSAQPLVVLLDYRMPGMDGREVLRAVAEDAFLATWHAYVFVTAEPGAIHSSLERLLDRLDAPVLEKPFELDALLAAVDAAQRRIGWGTQDLVADDAFAGR